MFFPQDKRFSDANSDKLNSAARMYIPPSTLNSHGTRIVDSWNSIDSSRLDYSLIIKGGVVIKAKKDWIDTAGMEATDLDIVKKRAPNYTFPKKPRSIEFGSICAGIFNPKKLTLIQTIIRKMV
jgi:hypothetical protein